MKPSITLDEGMIDSLRKDPAFASGLLNSVLDDGSAEEVAYVWDLVAKAAAPQPRNPVADLFSVRDALRNLGMKLTVVPATASA